MLLFETAFGFDLKAVMLNFCVCVCLCAFSVRGAPSFSPSFHLEHNACTAALRSFHSRSYCAELLIADPRVLCPTHRTMRNGAAPADDRERLHRLVDWWQATGDKGATLS